MLGDRDLANHINNPIGEVQKYGSKYYKRFLLEQLIPREFSKMHEERTWWIHDLEYYNLTYNCIGINVKDLIQCSSEIMTFDNVIRRLFRSIIRLTNQQSGGIGFINFDSDLKDYINDETDDSIIYIFRQFFEDLNHEVRKGCELAYITLNIGLDTSFNGRRISKLILQAYSLGHFNGLPFIFPNIVFKIKKGVNYNKEDKNYDIFQYALKITAKCMNPTYFNCDSTINKSVDENKIGIMGCRTRVVDNMYGEAGSINRGNIACLTLNLPQIALESKSLRIFYEKLDTLFIKAADLLEHRLYTLCYNSENNFQFITDNHLYLNCEDVDRLNMFRNGTLSIGFIGLWEAIAILLDDFPIKEEFLKDNIGLAEEVVKHMSENIKTLIKQRKLNFSLIGSSAENVSGQFPKHDLNKYGCLEGITTKRYYTNSFHIPVGLGINYFEKIKFEGLFHKYCNGGSITYVEFKEAPINNPLAIEDVIDCAIQYDCNYIGINYPLDCCSECNYKGIINTSCPNCKCTSILRLRRVSGYLSAVENFSDGKLAELNERLPHLK